MDEEVEGVKTPSEDLDDRSAVDASESHALLPRNEQVQVTMGKAGKDNVEGGTGSADHRENATLDTDLDDRNCGPTGEHAIQRGLLCQKTMLRCTRDQL